MNRRQLFGAGTTAALAVAPMMMMASTAMAAPTSAAAFSTVRRRMLSAADFGAMGDGTTDDTAALQKALDATFRNGDSTFLNIPPGEYRITKTLRVNVTGSVSRNCGITAHGARLNSAINNRTNVLEFVSTAPCQYLMLEGIDIKGSSNDSAGLKFETQNGGKFCNININDAALQGCGGDGMQMVGEVEETQIVNSYFRGNKGNGASFSGSAISGIHVFGCVFGDNGIHGAYLYNQAKDVAFHGCYLLLNKQFGLHAEGGCTLLANCGFENNHQGASSFSNGGAGAKLGGCATMIGCTAYSIYKQTHLVDSMVGEHLNMIGCTGSGSGAAGGAKLAKLRGDGSCKASLIGCNGGIDYLGGVEGLELGTDKVGAAFGSGWNSKNQVRLGGFYLWVDAAGRLRMKNGAPTSDGDGKVVGSQA